MLYKERLLPNKFIAVAYDVKNVFLEKDFPCYFNVKEECANVLRTLERGAKGDSRLVKNKLDKIMTIR